MRIGALVPRSGPAGLWGPSCEAALLLATAELNAAGGVGGRCVALTIADIGWSPSAADAAATELIDGARVDAVVGMHPSSTRAAVARRTAGRVPYVFTPQYEGGERRRGVAATGATDAQVLRPCVPWLIERRRANRFLIVRSDYVWPQRGGRTAAGIIADAGARVVGEATVPFGGDPSAALDAIRLLRPDVVVMFLLGLEAVRFNRAFAEAGLARHTQRLGLGVDETVLLGIGAEAAEGLHVATAYVASLRSAENAAFLERYHEGFGDAAPPTNVFARSCYDGIRLLARLAHAARRCEGRLGPAMLRAMPAQAGGTVGPTVHVAVADGLHLDIAASFPGAPAR